MADYTDNLNLKKPAGTDNINIADINGNMDLIDAAWGDVLTVNEQELTAEEQAQVRTNIGASGAITIRSVSVPLPASFAANSSYHTNLKTIIDADLPAGKKCAGIAGFDSGGGMIVIVQLRYANSDYSFQCANFASSAYSNKSSVVQYLCTDA